MDSPEEEEGWLGWEESLSPIRRNFRVDSGKNKGMQPAVLTFGCCFLPLKAGEFVLAPAQWGTEGTVRAQ